MIDDLPLLRAESGVTEYGLQYMQRLIRAFPAILAVLVLQAVMAVGTE
jgi:hypothetical protein